MVVTGLWWVFGVASMVLVQWVGIVFFSLVAMWMFDGWLWWRGLFSDGARSILSERIAVFNTVKY